ncbi:MAG TPA: TM0106 family RecB-like putative nuclease [Candidatus Limnocylindria bacterium]|nr:TM0106 family RecB-like putative nuclease [Candidatus Limnocylindria bacterium]
MQLIDGQPVFSATDLVGYLACEHLTALERLALADVIERPHRRDRELDIIRERGLQHEQRYLDDLRVQGRTIASIERREGEERGAQVARQAAETADAMASGVDVVFQATFFDGRWLGYADFLLKVEDAARPSVWGPWHYEVADTKLARHVKAGAVLQICSYVEQLERIQARRPRHMHVVLGGSARETATLRVDDYMAYYRAAKRRFEEAFEIPPGATYPEPVDHCDVCRWSEHCRAQRRADDHLSLVAGISSRQRKALVARGIDTVERLAAAPIPFDPPLDGASGASMERVREQARIQVEGRNAGRPLYELLPVEAERGLGILPPPNDGDLFLDLEGDPYASGDGIDYLFGVLDGPGQFTAIWSTDPDGSGDITLAGEKAAFERLMDLLTERRARWPEMHIYHYAPYEPTALKRLMGRHATREKEVDELLRGGVLVDLYRAVRQGLRASVESYSIKRIEPLYDFHREISLRDATSSIVAFEEWLQLSQSDRPSSQLLAEIEAYNRDDVRSTLALRDWLERLREQAAAEFGVEVPRAAPRSPEAPVQLTESDARVKEIADRLTDGVPVDPAARTREQAAAWLMAQLLSWHRREAKVAFWEFFDRMGKDEADLVRDRTALGPLELIGPLGGPWRPTPRSHARQTWAYRFEPQEHDLGGGRGDLYDPALYREQPDAKWSAWKVTGKLLGVDDAAAVVELTWPPDVHPRHPESLNPLNIFGDAEQRAALLALGTWVAEHGVDAAGPWRAARDLLLRRPPRTGQVPGSALVARGEDAVDAACRIVAALEDGALAIQGPPGSGKTYTGARMIVSLLRAGKQVGISATSHKVITHFLARVLEAADGVEVRAMQKVGDGGAFVDDPRVTLVEKNGQVQEALASGSCNVAAGTAWLWAAEKSADMVDVLFVDEAGQISLANVLAMARAARSIVLLGDPQQLEQPIQGSHPPGADRSALAHLLGDHDTMPEDLGIFLEHTWRLHPRVAAFTSEAFYEDRLGSEGTLERQALHGPDPLRGAGLRLLESEHAGSENASPEEARQVADIAALLVASGATWTDRHAEVRPVTWDDVLIVAPYNAQVGEIRRLLPPEARVGTVDKFQGQEAPISIYSMTTSTPEEAPRGMDFLYSRNRLNVATSRARCIAVVVASPALLRVRARTPEQMRLANALCQFVEHAERPPA